tara:strand:+ start:375 stop:1196 length:822 start_codon:yes stop_codon:yes gene_type:complete
MKNTKASYVMLLMSLVLMISTHTSIGCGVLSGNITVSNQSERDSLRIIRVRPPVDAFLKVDVAIESSPVDCHAGKKIKFDCDKLIKNLPTLKQEGSGSGMLVSTPHGPMVLTAAHVCTEDVPETYTHKGVTISILTSTKIRLRSPIGKTTTGLIVKLDHDLDLCLLRPGKIFTNPVEISTRHPVVGDKVYAISAPYGISDKNLSLIFTGYYSGASKNIHYYTIPTRPGSSGSSVLNESWEVIGTLNAAFRSIESIGLGAGLADVRAFIFDELD